MACSWACEESHGIDEPVVAAAVTDKLVGEGIVELRTNLGNLPEPKDVDEAFDHGSKLEARIQTSARRLCF